jgi:P-type Cu+ transporter
LTLGRPQWRSLTVIGGAGEDEVLRLAASAEAPSRHPLASAVVAEARNRALELYEASVVTILPGAGVKAQCMAGTGAPRQVAVGNLRLFKELGIGVDASLEAILTGLDGSGQTALIVAVDGMVAGVIGVADAIRPEAHDVIHELRHLKVKEVAVLTGDRAAAAKVVAKRLHADTFEAELLPAGKARWIEDRKSAGRRVAMIGDGINDAPALAAADAGIALGRIGADLAAEAGEIIMLGEPLRALPELVGLSRATVAVIRQNIIGFAFGLNAAAILAATLGVLGPVPAAILHQIGSFLVLLNAMRLLVYGNWAELPPIRGLRALGERIGRLDDRLDLEAAGAWLYARRRTLGALACVVLLVAYCCSGAIAVGPGEQGLLQRFGRYRALLEPGLHVRWPYPIEQVTRIAVDQMRSLEIGFRTAMAAETSPLRWESTHAGRTSNDDEAAFVLTGDGRYVELSATLQYAIDTADRAAARRYLLGVTAADDALRPLAESVVREVVGRRALLDLLTTGRREAEQAATQLLQERLAAYRFGIVARAISFQDIHPPLQVVDAYRDVSRSTSDRERRRNEANAYRDRAIAEATGKAQATIHAAEADQAGRLALAASAAETFHTLSVTRHYAPALTDVRIYWEKLAGALAGRPKVVLDDAAGRRRHLVLPGSAWEQAVPILENDRTGRGGSRSDQQVSPAQPAATFP